ncbi:MAG: ABC transporter ATP-binding protein [Deltaproteobacteria bacterium]|nr:MAG: ABC transporter ATP-binding protein [Deltaproteobacteria bacterium]
MVERPRKIRVQGVSLSFGGVRALVDVSVDIRENEILAIIGPNGAGKTSLLNCISGFYTPQKGEIFFEGRKITKLPSHKRAQLGIARTFQNVEVYDGLNVVENIMAGRHLLMNETIIDCVVYFGRGRREEVQHRKVVEEIIDFLELHRWREKEAGALPYGVRKRIELGRALALEPKVLLLDEPMAGMNIEEKEDLARFVIDIFEGQKARYPDNPVLSKGVKCVVLIEHDMGVVMDIADRIVVLDQGRKIAEGKPAEIAKNPEVIKAYLGHQAST